MYALDHRRASRPLVASLLLSVLILYTGCATYQQKENAQMLRKFRQADMKIEKIEEEAKEWISEVLNDAEFRTYRFSGGVKSDAFSLIRRQRLVDFVPQLSRIAKLTITKDNEVHAFQDAVAVYQALRTLERLGSQKAEKLSLARLVCGEDGFVLAAVFRNLVYLQSWDAVPRALNIITECRQAMEDELALQRGLEYVLASNAMPTEFCDPIASLKDLYMEELKHPYSTSWQQIEANFDLLLQRHCSDSWRH